MTVPVLCGGCQQYHGGVADVRKCFTGQGADYNYPDREMAERRLGALNHTQDMAEFNELLSQSSVGQKLRSEQVPEGVYVRNGDVFKVITALHGSGHRYAKVLVPQPDKDDGKPSQAKWCYAKGAINNLTLDDKLTPEKAVEFGSLYNVCCNCGIPLTREESKRRCYGPTCADNLGWPYDHSAD